MTDTIRINRAPVLTLWAAVVAERLGFDRATALTLGQAVAGSSAYAKGVSPRHHRAQARPGPRARRAARPRASSYMSDLLGRAVPVVRTPEGLRAVSKGKPGNPASIEKYLASKFGERLGDARQAMAELAAACEPADLSWRGFRLYEQFRPAVPTGESGLGSEGRAGFEEGAGAGVDRLASLLYAQPHGFGHAHELGQDLLSPDLPIEPDRSLQSAANLPEKVTSAVVFSSRAVQLACVKRTSALLARTDAQVHHFREEYGETYPLRLSSKHRNSAAAHYRHPGQWFQ